LRVGLVENCGKAYKRPGLWALEGGLANGSGVGVAYYVACKIVQQIQVPTHPPFDHFAGY